MNAISEQTLGDPGALTMTYYDDLKRIHAAGHQHALDHIANGTTMPDENLFSGEWADGITGQDALDYAGIDAQFSDLEDFEQADVMDYFEDGYLSATWPYQQQEN